MRYRALLPKMTDQAGTMRLFCLPHAGGGSAPFYRVNRILPNWLELAPLTLPGREGRISEPPYDDLRQLASDAAEAIWPHLDHPYVVLGHSLGAVAAFELVRELRRRGGALPRLLIVVACRGPQMLDKRSPIHELPQEQFLSELAERYDGIPDAIRQNRELVDLLLPTMRADVRMLETYCFRPEQPLDVDILALGGTSDVAITVTHLNAWREHTSTRFSTRLVPGGHFFLFDDSHGHSNAAWEIITNRLHSFRTT